MKQNSVQTWSDSLYHRSIKEYTGLYTMQGDVSDEEVRQEYDEYRKELSAFLESPLINARADKFLTGDRYLYIFMCFGIRPDQNENPLAGGGFRRNAADEDRHAVEKKVFLYCVSIFFCFSLLRVDLFSLYCGIAYRNIQKESSKSVT